ncbi:3-oxoacyl-ACP synthase [Actinopolyspora erythraea]|uniref:3-oxoacyl-ACP synthase n=1 Tax=Actinopolyspora erythraea TaxID=414996 RepID=A0A099D8N8_9ACTN|nr:beta-ketoacyl-[acyl-carrier-protein] synthase family protein [Actinopolyspora erythraea]ASU79894.1 3-oxoacyl-ACP synthase [Actinopolyspora erythraea]KGI82389.1 3-oxoacyl-ACP synthase [Actinopolyspora erythraea]
MTFPARDDTGERVVVTGMGVVSPIATELADYVAALRAGRTGAAPITGFDTTGFDHPVGCEVNGFRPERWIRRLPVERLGRAARFAVAAARMAVRDARPSEDALRGDGVISVGTTNGGGPQLERLVETEALPGGGARDPLPTGTVLPHNLATSISQELDLPSALPSVLGTACAAGNHAIGEGVDAVRSGVAEFALCGGADAMSRKLFSGFSRLGLLAPDACRPFDSNRAGILLSEGAGMLLLESRRAALARGAPIHAEVLGYGLNCDALHPVAPDRASVASCTRTALRDAGVSPRDVDLISAHGTGTGRNDVTEAGAVLDVYGEAPPPTVSVKSMLGHAMGAASALAAIACVSAITHGFAPPTINHRELDPECPIDCVPNRAVEADLRIVQSNGLAFGGSNAVVIFGEHDGRTR